jgi:threonine dehydrogenase-like Zn-dependent dehydrogenase
MSTWKAAVEADIHKRVPRDVAQNPTIIGHEFAGELVEVGSKWSNRFKSGDKFSIQPALNDENGPVGILSAPGYSYRHIGGNSTYIIIPNVVMEKGCLLKYNGQGYFPASLSEPLSCVIGAIHANYHTTPGSYHHLMEIKNEGNMAILAGAGPMGLAAINYTILRADRRPKLLVITDIDANRLERAASLYSPEMAAKNNIELKYINTNRMNDPVNELKAFTGGQGYHDVFVFAPVASIIELGDDLLAFDGCLNFFAGPPKSDFKVPFNFYHVHYGYTHIVGTSGGNTDDMKEALEMISQGLDPAGFVTHIGGIDSVIETTMNLPSIPGGKKLIYNHIHMPLTAIADFQNKGNENPLFADLHKLCERHNGLWNLEAEARLLDSQE